MSCEGTYGGNRDRSDTSFAYHKNKWSVSLGSTILVFAWHASWPCLIVCLDDWSIRLIDDDAHAFLIDFESTNTFELDFLWGGETISCCNLFDFFSLGDCGLSILKRVFRPISFTLSILLSNFELVFVWFDVVGLVSFFSFYCAC